MELLILLIQKIINISNLLDDWFKWEKMTEERMVDLKEFLILESFKKVN